jgi:hypothetical protein
MDQFFSKIWIVVAVAVFAVAGVFCWQYFISQEESRIIVNTQESSINEQELATVMIFDFMDSRMKTSGRGDLDRAKSCLTNHAREDYSQMQFIDFALVGISNPHFSRFEILKIEKLNFDKFKFTVRIYEELTSEGEIGYFDEILTVMPVGKEFLIDSVEKKDYVNIQDKIAIWKTYRNEEYGFEVKYPNDWEKCFSKDKKILLRIIPPISDSDILEGGGSDYFRSNACLYGSIGFDIGQRKDFNLEKLKKYYSDLYKDHAECNPDILIEETIFNNYPALKIGSCDLSGMYSGTMTVFFHNQTEFRVHVSSSAVRTAGQEIIDQMLSSFRFIEIEKTECEKWREQCAKEGEGLCSACGCRNCCSGLVSRDSYHPWKTKDNEIVCLENMTAQICVKCGDKICGKGEDWCICPEDCSKPSLDDLEICAF